MRWRSLSIACSVHYLPPPLPPFLPARPTGHPSSPRPVAVGSQTLTSAAAGSSQTASVIETAVLQTPWAQTGNFVAAVQVSFRRYRHIPYR